MSFCSSVRVKSTTGGSSFAGRRASRLIRQSTWRQGYRTAQPKATRTTNQAPTPSAISVNTSRPIWSGWRAGRVGAMVRRRKRFHIAQDCREMEAFGTVLIAICLIAVIVAAFSYRGTGGLYRGVGRAGGLSMDGEHA